jgi:D-alanine-D-alanine ligase
MRVAVVFGGASVEHEISIITGVQTVLALNKTKYEVIPIYLTKDHRFLTSKNFDKLETFKQDHIEGKEVIFTNKGIKRGLIKKKIDVAVACVHGKGLEGGNLAGFFELLQIPYTAIGPLGASIGQDKIIFKKLMAYEAINVIPFTALTLSKWRSNRDKILAEIKALSFPVIIKPASLGSSIGIKKVENINDLEVAINAVMAYDDRVIVEECLSNFREFNCAIIDQDHLSSIEEVITKHDILTFADKYEEGPAQRIIPADIPSDLAQEIKDLTINIATIIDNKGVMRIDYLYDLDQKILYVNEVNTIPGSLSYYLFEDQGLFFDELLDELINRAMRHHYEKNRQIMSFTSNVLNMKSIKK